MSKEDLEALERGIIEFEKDLEDDCNNEWLKRVVAGMKKCYQRLEQIDNANLSEAMEWIDKHIDWNCEKIEELKNRDKGVADIYDNENKMLVSIKQALQRLESIDNAKPSEALEELERIGHWELANSCMEYVNESEEFNTIKKALFKAQENEKENDKLKRWLGNER